MENLTEEGKIRWRRVRFGGGRRLQDRFVSLSLSLSLFSSPQYMLIAGP
jgi:hypothetical protein